MNSTERAQYWIDLEDTLLLGSCTISEWCSFISKSVYDAFVAGADLAVIITALACLETYFKTEDPELKDKSFFEIINTYPGLPIEERENLHMLRKYRNSWVHCDRIDDTPILDDYALFENEAEDMAILTVKILLQVLFLDQWI